MNMEHWLERDTFDKYFFHLYQYVYREKSITKTYICTFHTDNLSDMGIKITDEYKIQIKIGVKI